MRPTGTSWRQPPGPGARAEQDLMTPKLSIVLPARNEAAGLRLVLPTLRQLFHAAGLIVIDDGSTDDTAKVAAEAGACVLRAPYSVGNGDSIKRGARQAAGELLVLMDTDGQHDPREIQKLLDRLDEGYDMAVGACDSAGQASVGRSLANGLYNRLASWVSGFPVIDLTSGFRAVRTARFREFPFLLPNGFSCPTTITMAFLHSAHAVAHVPVEVSRRIGTSHIRPLRDGIRCLLINLKIATLYSPPKLFLPAAICFFLTGAGYYAYTHAYFGRFTNMGTLMLTAAVIVFLVGLVAEQITAMSYGRGRD